MRFRLKHWRYEAEALFKGGKRSVSSILYARYPVARGLSQAFSCPSVSSSHGSVLCLLAALKHKLSIGEQRSKSNVPAVLPGMSASRPPEEQGAHLTGKREADDEDFSAVDFEEIRSVRPSPRPGRGGVDPQTPPIRCDRP